MSTVQTRLEAALAAQVDALRVDEPVARPVALADVVAVLAAGPSALSVSRRRRRQALTVAGSAVLAGLAAVAVVAVGVNGGSGDGTATHAVAASPSTHRAAPSPYGLEPGKYLKLSRSNYSNDEVWIPADPSGTWTLYGPSVQDQTQPPSWQTRPCAAFGEIVDADNNYIPGSVPTCESGGWMSYRPKFAESLPHDAAGVLASLRAAAAPSLGGPDVTPDDWNVEEFFLGKELLATGFTPDSIARTVEAAVRLIPGVKVTQHVSDGAGGYGDLIARSSRVKKAPVRTEGVVIDPSTGRVLAEYLHDGAITVTVDGKTGLPLPKPRFEPATLLIAPIRYQVVDHVG